MKKLVLLCFPYLCTCQEMCLGAKKTLKAHYYHTEGFI